ncbi:hypothetical protein ACUN0C_06915 [Faunimonas sp. B44]|uniref:hypothetical protein n=1 Tax=Faunimonas sp. B44 TaxID=3461493 RepID=UPI004043EEF9
MTAHLFPPVSTIDTARKPSLEEAVRSAVAKAIADGEILCVGKEARRIAAERPGVPEERVAHLLLCAGISARVDLELAPPQ